jgi:hypothetical protein
VTNIARFLLVDLKAEYLQGDKAHLSESVQKNIYREQQLYNSGTQISVKLQISEIKQ